EPMPPIEKLLARLTSGNPYNPPGSFIFPPGNGLRRLQDALGASSDYSVLGYDRKEAPQLFEEIEAALAEQAKGFEDQDRLIVRVRRPAAGGGPVRVRTRGLRKFGSADLVVESVPIELAEDAVGLLRDIAEHLSQGELLGPDESIDYGLGKIRLVSVPPLD